MTNIDITDNLNLFDNNFQNEEDGLTISELFDNAYEIYKGMQDNERLKDDDRQAKLLTVIRLLQRVKISIKQLELFSLNEHVDEISTNELRYILVDALLGYFYQSKSCGGINKRLAIVENASDCYRRFLEKCRDIEVTDKTELSTFLSNLANKIQTFEDTSNLMKFPDILQSAKTRQEKIAKFKKSKNLQKRIQELEDNKGKCDESLRELNINRILLWISRAMDDLECLEEERSLLKYRNDNQPLVPSTVDDKQNATPFVLLSTRQDRKAKVFGAGYPSLPTLSIEEFYDSLKKRNIISECHQLSPQPPKLTDDEIQANIDDAKDNDKDQEYVAMKREMDDWKDCHRRGEGNRHNRS